MNETIDLLTAQISGYEAKLTQLRADKSLFDKAKGLDEAAEKSRGKIETMEIDIEDEKESLANAKHQRLSILESSLGPIKERMGQVLPSGEAKIEIEDGKLILGWVKDDIFRPIDSLSGGELISFNAALSYVLLADAQNKFLILEAAELDESNLSVTMDKLKSLDAQVLIITCHLPANEMTAGLVDGWSVVEMGT